MLKQVEMLGGAEAVGLEGESDDRDRRPSSRPEACFCTCRDASRRRVRSMSAHWRRMERIGRRGVGDGGEGFSCTMWLERCLFVTLCSHF